MTQAQAAPTNFFLPNPVLSHQKQTVMNVSLRYDDAKTDEKIPDEMRIECIEAFTIWGSQLLYHRTAAQHGLVTN